MRQRPMSFLTVLALATLVGGVFAPAAGASPPERCLVINSAKDLSYENLQAAVDGADAGDTLWVRGTCTGTTTIAKDLTVTGQTKGHGFGPPTLDGVGSGTVVSVSEGSTVVLDDLTITGGSATQGAGAGIDNAGTVTLDNSTVKDNTAFTAGGGIYNYQGTVTLNGSSAVSGNDTRFDDGGGIYNYRGTVTLNDSSAVSGNETSSLAGSFRDGEGGGIFNSNLATVTLNDSSTITGNIAGYGGGIFNWGVLYNVVSGAGGNVYGNVPSDITVR